MFNFGFSELFALAVLALLVIGPKQLPELARNVAKLLNEFKRLTSQVTDPLHKTQNQIKNFDNQAQDFLQRAEQNIEGYVRQPDPGERLEDHEPIQEEEKPELEDVVQVQSKDSNKNES